ncbi:hypothetical protein M3215_11640 [Bacillus cytotoxicus]|uniref:Uncharacterized protein n=1 Tax=Bacillus cytotoxicus TaxID=580165 RepID=A0ACC6A747_9BACI|nr:hypothetical protein [Bacillus cytotoxicus]
MCNRCDGGNKELETLICNNKDCQFVFYKVVEETIDDVLCPKCRKGIGILEAGEGE